MTTGIYVYHSRKTQQIGFLNCKDMNDAESKLAALKRSGHLDESAHLCPHRPITRDEARELGVH